MGGVKRRAQMTIFNFEKNREIITIIAMGVYKERFFSVFFRMLVAGVSGWSF